MSVNTVATTRDTFQQDVLEAKIPVIVDLWAPWCGPCKVITPALQKIAEARADIIRIATIDIVEYPEFKDLFSITAIPCLVLMQHGQETSRITGPSSAQSLIIWLDEVLPLNTPDK